MSVTAADSSGDNDDGVLMAFSFLREGAWDN
jgi:hypothetical protein